MAAIRNTFSYRAVALCMLFVDNVLNIRKHVASSTTTFVRSNTLKTVRWPIMETEYRCTFIATQIMNPDNKKAGKWRRKPRNVEI